MARHKDAGRGLQRYAELLSRCVNGRSAVVERGPRPALRLEQIQGEAGGRHAAQNTYRVPGVCQVEEVSRLREAQARRAVGVVQVGQRVGRDQLYRHTG